MGAFGIKKRIKRELNTVLIKNTHLYHTSTSQLFLKHIIMSLTSKSEFMYRFNLSDLTSCNNYHTYRHARCSCWTPDWSPAAATTELTLQAVSSHDRSGGGGDLVW